MRKIILAALAATGLTLGWAAMEDDDMANQLISTDTARPAEEDDYQAVIQESDADLAAFVLDYITKDVQLKGDFFIENRSKKQALVRGGAAAGQCLRLKLVSLEKKTKSAAGGTKMLSSRFMETSGAAYEVRFYLQSSSYGGPEIIRIEAESKPSAGAKTGSRPGK